MGDPDKADLQTALENAGWHVERRDGDDWWQHEVWVLASTWRPVGTAAFLVLLIDPQATANAAAAVWAISVLPEETRDYATASRAAIRVRPRWPERMKEIVGAVGAFRHAG